MKLLAWDTSSKEGAIAALEWDENSRAGWQSVRLAAEWSLNVDLSQSDRLLWGIHQVLQACRWKLADLDLIGVGVGPGSFTGLRVGITTARTLAHTMKKPIVGVSSLAAMARPVALWLGANEARTVVVAATDASKGELFGLWGSARSVVDCVVPASGDFRGHWKRGVEEQVIEPAELMREVRRKLNERKDHATWVGIGEGRKRYLDDWATLPSKREVEIPVNFVNQVQGRYLAQLVWEGFQAGLARKALDVHPRYLRMADAEKKLRAGLLKPAPVSS